MKAWMGVVVVFLSLGCEPKELAPLRVKLGEVGQKASSYTEMVLKIGDESSMTFKDLFDTCEKASSSLADLTVEIKSTSPGLKFEPRDKLLAIIETSTKLIQLKKALYREQMELSSALDSFQRATKMAEVMQTLEGKLDALKDMEEAQKEFRERSEALARKGEELASLYTSALTEEEALAALFGEENIPYEKVIAKHKDTNQKLTDEIASAFGAGAKSQEASSSSSPAE